MIRVLHLPTSPLTSGYSSEATGRGWKPGEVRRVKPKVARYLAETFPESFGPAPEGWGLALDADAIDPDGPASIEPIPDHRDARIAELEAEAAGLRRDLADEHQMAIARVADLEAERDEARAELAEARREAETERAARTAAPTLPPGPETLPPEPTEG